MKKSFNLLGLMLVAVITLALFNIPSIARTVGYLYGDALVIGYPGTTVASISSAGVGNFTGMTNTGTFVNTGALSATTTVTGGTGLIATAGPIRPYSRTKAQILAITSVALGDTYYCNDCTAVTLCVSTGTTVKSFVKVDDKSAVCD